jgi:hypothetical protein
LKKFREFVLFCLHNSMLLYFAYIFFPSKFVLANSRLSFWAAVFVSGIIWALIIKRLLLTIQTKSLSVRFILSWLFNFIAIWIVARIAPYSGFGVVKFTWLIGLSFFANMIQMTITDDKK